MRPEIGHVNKPLVSFFTLESFLTGKAYMTQGACTIKLFTAVINGFL
jgi:hypothetical protein